MRVVSENYDISNYWEFHQIGIQTCLNCPYEDCIGTNNGCELLLGERGEQLSRRKAERDDIRARLHRIRDIIADGQPRRVSEIASLVGVKVGAINYHIRAGNIIACKIKNVMYITGVSNVSKIDDHR